MKKKNKQKEEAVSYNTMRTFSQCGEVYDPWKFTKSKCLEKKRGKNLLSVDIVV